MVLTWSGGSIKGFVVSENGGIFGFWIASTELNSCDEDLFVNPELGLDPHFHHNMKQEVDKANERRQWQLISTLGSEIIANHRGHWTIIMEQPPVQIGQYVLGKNLGIGAFGKVRLVSCPSVRPSFTCPFLLVCFVEWFNFDLKAPFSG